MVGRGDLKRSVEAEHAASLLHLWRSGQSCPPRLEKYTTRYITVIATPNRMIGCGAGSGWDRSI